MGSDELNENLYLIYFGLAKKYSPWRTLNQYPPTLKKKIDWDCASIHVLDGY